MKKINVKDKKFLKCVRNTIQDLIQHKQKEINIIGKLKEIYNNQELTLFNREAIYLIIKVRKENLNFIKLIQDRESFNIVNKEHKYMEKFLNKYFSYNVCPNTGLCSITMIGE